MLKIKLAKSFAMKDLGAAKQILGMRITRDRENCKLTLSQGEYIEKVLQRFRMQNEKPITHTFGKPFQTKQAYVSRDTGRDRLHVQDSLFINSWELDVCHGVHKTKYCTCSGSCE